MIIKGKGIAATLMACACLTMLPDTAEADNDRFTAGGYFRVAARPDFIGSWSKLGLWNLSGRLLNETQWAALEMRLMLVDAPKGSNEVWTSVHAKIEGGSVHGTDLLNGSLQGFSLSRLYVKAGNMFLKDVTWQVGTMHYSFGDLGLYDMTLAEIFDNTVGMTVNYNRPKFEVVAGLGDSGYLLKGTNYNSVITAGAAFKVRPISGFEFGAGAQLNFEPAVKGNTGAMHQTEFESKYNIGYESFARKKVIEDFRKHFQSGSDGDVQMKDALQTPSRRSAFSFKSVAYLGFGNLGPLTWNNLYASFSRRHPEVFVTEKLGGDEIKIFVKDWTDERYSLQIGNETQLKIVPDYFDVTWAGLFGYDFDKDDKITASERNRRYWSLVLRSQAYILPTLHFLFETSFAQERSLNGNLWRKEARSIGKSTQGLTDIEGLEYGDIQLRNTWQGKTGFVLNPGGRGIFSRPSIRLLYGVQYSNMHNAFPNKLDESIDMNNPLYGKAAIDSLKTRHWHHVISIEAEAWF